MCAFVAPMTFEIHSPVYPEIRTLPESYRTGDHFYLLAKPLLADASVDDHTLELLQSLLLLNRYHARSPGSPEIVRTHEWQIRVAPLVKESLREPWERQIYERAWWMIVQNDSMFALQRMIPSSLLGPVEKEGIDEIKGLSCESPLEHEGILCYRAFLHGGIMFVRVMSGLYNDEVREWSAQGRYDLISPIVESISAELDTCFCREVEINGLSLEPKSVFSVVTPTPLRFRESACIAALLAIAHCKCTMAIYFPLLPQGPSPPSDPTFKTFAPPYDPSLLQQAQIEAIHNSACSAARMLLLAHSLRHNDFYAFPIEQIRDAAAFFLSFLPILYHDTDYPTPTSSPDTPDTPLSTPFTLIRPHIPRAYLHLLLKILRTTPQYIAGARDFTDFVALLQSHLPTTLQEDKVDLDTLGGNWVPLPLLSGGPVYVKQGVLIPKIALGEEEMEVKAEEVV